MKDSLFILQQESDVLYVPYVQLVRHRASLRGLKNLSVPIQTKFLYKYIDTLRSYADWGQVQAGQYLAMWGHRASSHEGALNRQMKCVVDDKS